MKASIFILLLFGLMACNTRQSSMADKQNIPVEKQAIPDFKVALQFINEYAAFCKLEIEQKSSDTNWIQRNLLLTDKFKTLYKSILDSAFKADPELGLDFDPIFDAQDFPDKGFSILKTDTLEKYVTVNGNDWKDFELVLKLAFVNNKWLVDGAGVINIPNNRQAKR